MKFPLVPILINLTETMDTLTDKGYTTGVHIDTCTKNNITTFSSPKAHSSQKIGLYDMKIFVYSTKKDTYTCPAGAIHTTNGNVYKKRNNRVKHYKNRTACKDCQLRSQCTTNKNGRFIRAIHLSGGIKEDENRVKKNPDYYKLRQQITEHLPKAFGRDLKAAKGF